MAKSIYKGIVISDLHVGAMNLERTREEFTNVFISHIKKMKKLDFLIVDGDFFDKQFNLGDKVAVVAHAMLKELIDVCDKKGTKIRFVYGTESHERNQYSVMSVLDLSKNIKVVKYAEEEELLPNMHILYLPEEHLYDKDEYYKDFFKNTGKYDYIFGHGVISEVWKEKAVMLENKEKDKSKRKKVPLFTARELAKCCNGQIYFGHYHINKEIDGKIFSVGSFNRWQFGEEGRKGFYELTFDYDKRTYDYEFIENTMAETYATISYGYDNEVFKSEDDMTEALNHMDKMIKDNIFDHVRFVFNIPEEIENPEATINYLKERYKSNDQIKVVIEHGYIEEKRKREKEQIDEVDKKFSFVLDKNLSLEDKVSYFISITVDKDISVEDVSFYLYTPLNEILEQTIK